ncbi:hypothetical protein QLX08_007515 [Tetragonisca angustula]|uniref:Uncharacterized protein n=1 Tax=Tetragonisca angustula TaxID=166442 RepID=A0AAW0ZP96_9HYME
MDSMDDDMFVLSDEELPISTPKCNPIEEHLTRASSDVRTRIERATNDIKEVQDMTRRILESLYKQARYGEDVTSDSDSDLYTINGQLVVKKKKYEVSKLPHEFLVINSNWKYVFTDKWVIGVELTNSSNKKINNPQVYVSLKEDDDNLRGMSTFWKLENEIFSYQTNEICPSGQVVATVVLDLPKFDKRPFYDIYGTIVYEVEEREYQIPVPVIRLKIDDTIDNGYQVKFLNHVDPTRMKDVHVISPMILALRSTSIEKNVDIQMKEDPERKKQLVKFLKKYPFQEIHTNVHFVQTTGCLMHCLIEILPVSPVEKGEKLRISSRSSHQMNIIIGLLREYFPDMLTEENVSPMNAAMVLMEELKLYLEDTSTANRQLARIATDLVIP